MHRHSHRFTVTTPFELIWVGVSTCFFPKYRQAREKRSRRRRTWHCSMLEIGSRRNITNVILSSPALLSGKGDPVFLKFDCHIMSCIQILNTGHAMTNRQTDNGTNGITLQTIYGYRSTTDLTTKPSRNYYCKSQPHKPWYPFTVTYMWNKPAVWTQRKSYSEIAHTTLTLLLCFAMLLLISWNLHHHICHNIIDIYLDTPNGLCS